MTVQTFIKSYYYLDGVRYLRDRNTALKILNAESVFDMAVDVLHQHPYYFLVWEKQNEILVCHLRTLVIKDNKWYELYGKYAFYNTTFEKCIADGRELNIIVEAEKQVDNFAAVKEIPNGFRNVNGVVVIPSRGNWLQRLGTGIVEFFIAHITDRMVWRLTYNDGTTTSLMTYSGAYYLKTVFGGRMWIDYDNGKFKKA